MSAPFGNLSEDNHDQIRKYLRYFRQKKETILRAIQREIADIKSDKLEEDVYTKEDMSDFVDFLSSAVRAQVSGDLGSIINMGALALNQLLENSQEKGIDLQLETSALENQSLLDAVDKMSLDSIPRASKKVGSLTSFKDEAKAMRDETSRLEETNARLKSEVASLRQRLMNADMENRNLSESKRNDDYERNHVRDLEKALEEAKEENVKRVSETPQFQQMRKLMQSQSSKIRDLRRRLQKYEPEAVKEDDF